MLHDAFLHEAESVNVIQILPDVNKNPQSGYLRYPEV